MKQGFLFPFPLSGEEIMRRRADILALALASDEDFCSIPVRCMRTETLSYLVSLYDQKFLSGFLSSSFNQIDVSLSSRLTSSAGKFIYTRSPSRIHDRVEIRMSSDFLFRLEQGPFLLNGLSVSTPQEAFLIVLEHEICHALETAIYGSTGHSRRFLTLANGVFGHTGTRHSLPTRKQEAAQNGLLVGSRVSFPHEGKQYAGLVSYVGKSITVMVPSWRGNYKDASGRRYIKFRVPPELIEKTS